MQMDFLRRENEYRERRVLVRKTGSVIYANNKGEIEFAFYYFEPVTKFIFDAVSQLFHVASTRHTAILILATPLLWRRLVRAPHSEFTAQSAALSRDAATGIGPLRSIMRIAGRMPPFQTPWRILRPSRRSMADGRHGAWR